MAQLREMAKKDVKGMMEALAEVGYKELKKNGVFVVPGFAKFVVIKKAATKARKGVNPFNGEEMMFKAKPPARLSGRGRSKPPRWRCNNDRQCKSEGPPVGGLLLLVAARPSRWPLWYEIRTSPI